jgi:hypothetical protein
MIHLTTGPQLPKGHTASDDKIVNNDGRERMWKETVVSCFKVCLTENSYHNIRPPSRDSNMEQEGIASDPMGTGGPYPGSNAAGV